VFVGATDVVVEVAVLLLKLVPLRTVEVVEAPDPISSVLVDEDVDIELESVPVAFEVNVVLSVKRVPYVVESVRELIDS